MARLFEYQGKTIIEDAGISVPRSEVISTADEAQKAAERIGFPVVLKSQVWVTGRASAGGISFAESQDDVFAHATRMLGALVKGQQVLKLLIEEKLDIASEYFLGMTIDDVRKRPVMMLSTRGGTGIEEIALKWPESIARMHLCPDRDIYDFEARDMLRRVGIRGVEQKKLIPIIMAFWAAARKYEARSAEINPLVQTKDGRFMAADCRMTIDDYAEFRHTDRGIEIAREFDRPATSLERIAYGIEAGDYRGTFYFFQMTRDFEKGEGVIGFHGAGGGGSMMSMDALLKRGYKLANFCDTSGNPPSSKVYRAARIILAQKNIDGYFASGSGVASQEQFHSARGLVKAFAEEGLSAPAVIRLGGNAEEVAIEILRRFSAYWPAPLEAYGKDDSPEFCAERLSVLLEKPDIASEWKRFDFPSSVSYSFRTITGRVDFDHERCLKCEEKPCIDACAKQILKLTDGVPRLAIAEDAAAKGRCTECLACELECHLLGNRGIKIELPISGLDDEAAS
ncbi:acetate--CoA ligase family protein [bacterium]|nr:acetate--CoA ligase family protein [bacterium]